MDLVLGLLCLTVAIVSSLVIYYISVSSIKERTYDEVKAEQKKKAEEYFAQGRTAKEKAKDKKLKKAGKKVKEKMSSESLELSSDERVGGKGHVAFMEPATVVDEEPVTVVDEEPVVIEEKKKKNNKRKEKPILINKNEITPVSDAEVLPPTFNHFEQILPKDDFSLKRSISREDVEVISVEAIVSVKSSAPKQIKTKEPRAEKQVVQKPVDKPANPSKASPVEKLATKPQEKQPQVLPRPVEGVPAVKTVAKPTQATAVVPITAADNASPSSKANRKKRTELATLQQMSGEKDAVNVNLLMPLVHKAELSRTEIQVLIDLLLNKQQGSSVESTEWIEGRQDPVVKLKKQLAEKEKALTAEQEAAVALQSKLRELRGELNAEKHATRQLEECLAARQTELNGLGGRLQHTVEEKQGLLQQIQQLQAKLSEEHMVLCKLQEDQGQTQTVLQQELLAQRQQLEMHISRLTEQHQETLSAMESQLGQLASQLQEQEALNSGLNAELALLRERGSQDLGRQQKEVHAEMERLMSQSQYDTSRLQSEVNSLTEQLSLKRAESDKLSCLVTSLQADNNRLTHQISSACLEAQQLRDENETLAAQVTASMERPATEGRENGDTSYPESKHIDNNSTDKVHEKELLIEKLKEDIISKDKELSRIKTDHTKQETVIKSLKDEMDISYKNVEKMAKEISSYKCLIQDHESVIKALREEGDSAHKLVNTLREDIGKNKAELVRLSNDCATREQLESRESAIEKLTSELNTHKTQLADQSSLIHSLQAELDKYKAQVLQLSGDSSKHDRLAAELNSCKSSLSEKEQLLAKLTTQLSQAEQQQEELARLRAEVADSKADLTRKLDTQRRKNDELRSKNWKAMEALTAAETKLKHSQTVASEVEERVRQQEQDRTKQVLLRVLPHIMVETKQDYDAWLEKFASCASSCVGGGGSNGEEEGAVLVEVEQQNSQLQALVTHYKSIIAETEAMLNHLQSHVEREETRWGHQLQTLQQQLEAVTEERDSLQAGLKNDLSTVDDGSDTN